MERMEIDRARWSSGMRYGNAYLLRDGNMCCLGFLGCHLGIEERRLLGRSYPYEVRDKRWPSVLDETGGHGHFDWEHILARINDVTRDSVDDETRESWIAAGFNYLMGIEVVFTGEYP